MHTLCQVASYKQFAKNAHSKQEIINGSVCAQLNKAKKNIEESMGSISR